MTYEARETGIQTAQPVELYTFTIGPLVFRYTSGQVPQVFDGATFEPVTLTRNAVETGQEVARSALVLTCANSMPMLAMYRPLPPTEVATLVVHRKHRGDTEAVVIWMGRILNVGWAGLQATIRCESVLTSVKRPGLRRLYQRQCPHVLYGGACGVNPAAYAVEREVIAISGLGISLASMGGFPAGYFAGGFLQWTMSNGLAVRRSVRDHTGATLTVNFQPLGLAVGDMLTVWPGCDHTLSATGCAKYSNTPNYGGFPYIPVKNPFDGTPVY